MSAAPTAYEDYLEDEWLLFAADRSRQHLALQAVEGTPLRAVLDVGCGGGQDLIPFASVGATCVGIDVAPESGRFAKRLFSTHYSGVAAHFVTSGAEHLPFADGSFDVVLCRVALPYTDNRRALSEMGRVLRPGGLLLLKTHAPAYYRRKFIDGVRKRAPLFCVHALRVLLTGTIYHLTGWQPRGGVLIRETFLDARQLRAELDRSQLSIVGELADTNPLTPSYRIAKKVHEGLAGQAAQRSAAGDQRRSTR